MADFNFNFNDIQKQIAVADLTEEQIQELMNALQTQGFRYCCLPSLWLC